MTYAHEANNIVVGPIWHVFHAATTEFVHWLEKQEQIEIEHNELYYLTHDQPGQLVETMYRRKPGNNNAIRGYKSPHELQRKNALKYYRMYFYKTKMIVGLRHPVRW